MFRFLWLSLLRWPRRLGVRSGEKSSSHDMAALVGLQYVGKCQVWTNTSDCFQVVGKGPDCSMPDAWANSSDCSMLPYASLLDPFHHMCPFTIHESGIARLIRAHPTLSSNSAWVRQVWLAQAGMHSSMLNVVPRCPRMSSRPPNLPAITVLLTRRASPDPHRIFQGCARSGSWQGCCFRRLKRIGQKNQGFPFCMWWQVSIFGPKGCPKVCVFCILLSLILLHLHQPANHNSTATAAVGRRWRWQAANRCTWLCTFLSNALPPQARPNKGSTLAWGLANLPGWIKTSNALALRRHIIGDYTAHSSSSRPILRRGNAGPTVQPVVS